MTIKRIGIFSGVFDPIHKGHIGFALEAIKETKLDEVYLLLEANPRRKTGVTHVSHRIAMAKLATKPYKKLRVLELPDRQFSVAKTLPRLQMRFPNSELVMLIGSDMLEHMPDWPLVSRLRNQTELVVGVRQGTTKAKVTELIAQLPDTTKQSIMFKSPAAGVSSAAIREAVRDRHDTKSALPSIRGYIRTNWLYSAVPSDS
jgi:nicotinate-nucleotide adenylyltransferase